VVADDNNATIRQGKSMQQELVKQQSTKGKTTTTKTKTKTKTTKRQNTTLLVKCGQRES
jgi:hypothetical protein